MKNSKHGLATSPKAPKAPKAPRANWIKPSELLPPVGEMVFVCHRCNPSSVMTYTLVLGADESFRRNIACWTPLPEPPKSDFFEEGNPA